ncbi:MAG TPA: asparagine synthase (glutamine-hydrolyzing) [Chloroflexi bacterium]|jgi:asparagine synthase (glutamine-hydrolysing)|nr:asparagine synthase (glutamine-hydrolyzing) [Chloroflexota bacterium]
MCGIVGWVNTGRDTPVCVETLRRMLAMIRHRGPDAFGVYIGAGVGLGSARLSIIDLEGGQQPIHNEDHTAWVISNGEIYNYVELRAALEAAGHAFATQSDTEVIVHLYEEYGPSFIDHLNGPFALALWDERSRALLLARDRLGIRPLYYTTLGDRFLFASEIKALFAAPGVTAEIDPRALVQVLTFWTTLSPYTAFRGVRSVPPGHTLRLADGRATLRRYWALDLAEEERPERSLDDAAYELLALLVDAIRLRLRADVPVGAYLSGGLDSSTTAALAQMLTTRRLRTFGIGFSDPAFDETPHQERMSAFLGTEHRAYRCTPDDLAATLAEVVWHSEMPLVRTAPAPMFLLSRLVRGEGYRVVLTGEGADEILGGYDIYKEAKVRRFWAQCPGSAWRSLPLRRLYPYVAPLASETDAYLRGVFGRHLEDTDDALYSHRLRWANTARCRRFLAADLRQHLEDYDPLEELRDALPAAFTAWPPLGRAQYLEMTIFMSEYLLSSQGDRMMMAHSVEGRYPFLDHRVVEFCSRLPSRYRLAGLKEKWVLRRAVAPLLPPEVIKRRKQPYRAPIAGALAGASRPEALSAALAPDALADGGLFHSDMVQRLVAKCDRVGSLGEVDEMALVAVLSTQLLHQQFIAAFPAVQPVDLDTLIDRSALPARAATPRQGPTPARSPQMVGG